MSCSRTPPLLPRQRPRAPGPEFVSPWPESMRVGLTNGAHIPPLLHPPRTFACRLHSDGAAGPSGPIQSHLPGSPSLRLAQGVLWGRHAATRHLGRRAGTQHGRQTRPAFPARRNLSDGRLLLTHRSSRIFLYRQRCTSIT